MWNTIQIQIAILALILVLYNPARVYSGEDVPVPDIQYQQYYENFTLKDRFTGEFYPQLEHVLNELKPNVGGEVFYDFILSDHILNANSTEEIDRLFYKTLISFSTQAGIEYYSYRRKRYRTYIETSYSVRSLQERTQQADDTLLDNDEIPAESIFYVYQEDSSFSRGVKSIKIFYNKSLHQFYIQIINEDPIKYKGVLTVAGPHDSVAGIIINRENETVSMYGATATNANAFSLLRKRTSISMVFRIYALAMWFQKALLENIQK